MFYTFADLTKILPYILNRDNPHPILLRGPTGIGKSAFARALQGAMLKISGIEYGYVSRRASQQTEGDQLGLPFAQEAEGCTDYYPMHWYMEAMKAPTIVFLDELDRGSQEVKQGYFELGDSRCLAGNYLHPRSILIAAINGGEDETNYIVNNMDPAELDRWVVFDVRPSVEDWISWAKTDGNIHPCIVDFIFNHKAHLEFNGRFKPGKIYPSRRSWDRLSQVIGQPGGLLEQAMDETNDDSPALTLVSQLTHAYVGVEAHTAFRAWVVEARKKVVTLEDVLNGKKLDKLGTFRIAEWSHFVDCWKEPQNKALLEKMSHAEIANLAYAFAFMPGEIFIKAHETLFRKDTGINLGTDRTEKLGNIQVTRGNATKTFLEWFIEFFTGKPIEKK